MLLIDSLYINNGGGKILLDYLVENTENENINCFYIFDKRCENDYLNINSDRKVYMDGNILKRHQFYIKNRDKFSIVLCFGNLAPTIKLDIPVYTYFHQPMYLNIPKEFTLKQRLKFELKTFIFSKLLKNTSKLLVQHDLMKQKSIKKFSLKPDDVLTLPFYPDEDLIKDSNIRETNTFIYVSNATPHKNHVRLLEAFIKFYDEYKQGKLIVTVSETFNEIYYYIKELIKEGYPIENIGFVGREELIKNYHKSEYLIFPSLEESFGLGIVEAIECGCKVIGANLPYMHQVCEPSIVFNPLDIKSIEKAFEKAIIKEEKVTTQKIFNQIDQLISLLKT